MSYVGVPPFGQTVRTITEVTATAGQTAFTPSGGYLPGYVDVSLNGIALSSADFTATNGITVTLAAAAAVGDEFRCVAYWPVSLMDTYRKSEVDAGFVAETSATGAALLPVGTTAQRPASPSVGMVRFNSELSYLEEYRQGQWVALSSVFVASGGAVTTSGGYKYHVFTSSGTFNVSSGSSSLLEYLVVGGGGGGGARHGGGGGGGGYISVLGAVSVGNYSIVIGAGGAGGNGEGTVGAGTTGNNSTFLLTTAIGGGGGGAYGDSGFGGIISGKPGGSGGGSAYNGGGGAGTSGQGNRGGVSSTGVGGAGGGGAGGFNDGSNSAGGAGLQWLDGFYYSGGGGGGNWNMGGNAANGGIGGGGGGNISVGGGGANASGSGGIGGGSARNSGGNGQQVIPDNINKPAGAGGANTGGGGGSGEQNYTGNTYRGVGGNGGSGIVVIRYPV